MNWWSDKETYSIRWASGMTTAHDNNYRSKYGHKLQKIPYYRECGIYIDDADLLFWTENKINSEIEAAEEEETIECLARYKSYMGAVFNRMRENKQRGYGK